MKQRLLAIFIGALSGYILGWLLGWTVFDPNSDLWALLAMAGALLGLVLGLLPGFWNFGSSLVLAAMGMYLGVLVRTLLFGDVPAGWGLVFVLGGTAAGWLLGQQAAFRQFGRPVKILVVALLAGFFGGFLIDVLLLDMLLGVIQTHNFLTGAPYILACGLVGGWLAGRYIH